MRLEVLPALARQRALLGMPRDMARFRAYLAEMTGGTGDGRRACLAAAFQGAWLQARGPPRTLRGLLGMVGQRMRFAGEEQPLPGAGLERVRVALAPHLEAPASGPDALAAMFGDAPARAWGKPVLGVPERGGFALAVADAMAAGGAPEDALAAP